MVMLQNVCKNCVRILEEEKLLLWQKVCVKRHHYQFTVFLNNWTFRIQSSIASVDEANWPSNAFSLRKVGLRSTYKRCRFCKKKKINFSDEAHFGLGGQSKLSHLGHRKPTRIHWKADLTKPSHCLVRILVQRHNWNIFLRKWARRGRYSQWRSLSVHVERIFVHKNWRGGYWQHLVSIEWRYVPHSRSYTRCFAPCFWRSHSIKSSPIVFYFFYFIKCLKINLEISLWA